MRTAPPSDQTLRANSAVRRTKDPARCAYDWRILHNTEARKAHFGRRPKPQLKYLAGSIGRLEQLDHPEVRRLVERVEEVILKSGKPMGTVPSAGASWQQLFDRGYRMVVGPRPPEADCHSRPAIACGSPLTEAVR